MDFINRIKNGDKRATARLITMVENKDPKALELMKEIYQLSGNAHVIGVTGPPGAGKSTLTDKLVKLLRKKEKTVAIIAVDPTSPFTGGSILGDRVRMGDLNSDSGVFIRSMGARGHLGGISGATTAAVKILDAYGVDYIFIETVGVGQSEIDIVKNCDTTVMVMVPGLGDDIQAIKSGVMEIGDVFAVNKADRDGARKTAREINVMLDFSKKEWRPPVELVTALKNDRIDILLDAIKDHYNYMVESNEIYKRRKQNSKYEILDQIKGIVYERLTNTPEKTKVIDKFSEKVANRELDPYSASQEILNKLMG